MELSWSSNELSWENNEFRLICVWQEVRVFTLTTASFPLSELMMMIDVFYHVFL